MAAFELSRYPKRKTQGKHGIVGLKIDMAKAYDRMEWAYLKGMLQSLGFVNVWIDRIMTCVSMVTYGVMLHGAEIGPVQPQPQSQRGLPQGDPLSPYLFIINAEGFSALCKTRKN